MTESPLSVGQRGADQPVRLLMLATAISSFDRFVIAPILLTVATAFEVELDQAASVAAVYFLLYGLSQPFCGFLSNKIGRVATMRLAFCLASVAGSVAIFATSLPLLIVSRAVAGAAMGAIIPTCLVYVGDSVPLALRRSTLTDIQAATAVGMTAAAAVGGLLASSTSWRMAFVAPTVASVLMVLVLRQLSEPERSATLASGGFLVVLRHRWGRRVLLLALVEGATFLGMLTFLAPALESGGASPAVAGLVLSLYGIGLLVASRLLKRIAGRVDPRTLLLFGAAALATAYASVATTRNVVAVGIAVVVLGAGWVALHTTMQAWATEVVPGSRAIMVSLFVACLSLGSGVSTAVLAPLAAGAQWDLLFGVSAAVALLFGLVASRSLPEPSSWTHPGVRSSPRAE